MKKSSISIDKIDDNVYEIYTIGYPTNCMYVDKSNMEDLYELLKELLDK